MYTPQQILNTAKAIQSVLPQLLDPAAASAMQAQLEPLLLNQDIAKIWETLDQFPQTQRWRTKYLNQEIATATRSGSQLAGDMVAQPSGLIYACPHCDYRDVVFLLGMAPDPCPDHPDALLHRV